MLACYSLRAFSGCCGRWRCFSSLLVLQEKQLACERYAEVHGELSGMKGRTEREIQSLKEHLRLAMAALQEGQKLGNSLDHWRAAAARLGAQPEFKQRIVLSLFRDFGKKQVSFKIFQAFLCSQSFALQAAGDWTVQELSSFVWTVTCLSTKFPRIGRFHYTGPHVVWSCAHFTFCFAFWKFKLVATRIWS